MKTQMFRIFSFVILVTAMAVAIAQTVPEYIKELQMKAAQGDAEAQLDLGMAYEFGKGVEKNLREATRWYRKSAEQGHTAAQYNFGVSYMHGKGVETDKKEGVRWLLKSAEKGYEKAHIFLWRAYSTGSGVEENMQEGVRWLRKAVEQGHAEAQFFLGFTYRHGFGVEKDPHEAIRWLRKAAAQDIADAKFNLGDIYYKGEGIKGDIHEAIRWYRKAAEQGYKNAQYKLGMIYHNGSGVPVNDYEGYIWLSIAKTSGHLSAAAIFPIVGWQKYLSQEEIRSAQKEAARRLQAIEGREEKSEKKAAIRANIAIASIPKETNVAEKVFENTWRSVVVILNGVSQGSGVIIRPNIVATNCHVVDVGGGITVYKSAGRRADTETALTATIRHSDEERDFCLLDVEGLWGIPATVRRYNTLKIGEDVYGLGAPQGLDLSLSDGLVSQLRKRGGQRMIQTNVATSPGSSGGGLFDSEGNLVGIMTSKITDKGSEGIGFAIPADLVLEF